MQIPCSDPSLTSLVPFIFFLPYFLKVQLCLFPFWLWRIDFLTFHWVITLYLHLISAVVTKILNLFSHSELLPEASCGWLNSFLSRKPFAMSNSVKKQSRSWLDSYSKPAQICSAVQKKKRQVPAFPHHSCSPPLSLMLAPAFVWLLGEPEGINPVITNLAKYLAKRSIKP